MKPGLALKLTSWRTKAGQCKVCGKPCPIDTGHCDNRHCRIKAKRKQPCKFVRLRNLP